MSRILSFIPERFYDRLKAMFRFGIVSGLASLVDFAIFLSLERVFMITDDVKVMDIIGSSSGMLVNFFMQKRFVFDLQRKTYAAFLLSISFSVIVMVAGAYSLEALGELTFIEANNLLWLAKLFVMGVKFVINFLSKRWVFERKVFRA